MSIKVFAVSKENAEKYKDHIVLWYYKNAPENCEDYYIGSIITSKNTSDIINNIEHSNNNIKLKKFLKILNMPSKATLHANQLDELLEETIIAKRLDLINPKDFNTIVTGIKIAKEKNLYLRFYYN